MGSASETPEGNWEERAATSELPAMDELYDQFGSVVFGVALRVIGDHYAAEDVTQAVFLRLWQHPDGFDPNRGSLRPWLVTLAHHRAVDWVRQEKAARRRDEVDSLTRPAAVADIEETVETTLETERLERVLETLPEGERAPIRLAYFGGRTYREVAVDLDLPEGTVKSRIRSGLRRMAAVLHSDGRTTYAPESGQTLVP